jgi:2-polyprenyl-6-methoxyphenol hydroxylase-like FAD-dependent oxidoreductase
MRTVIVGAGPTGLFSAMALARRGHQVTVVDRDPGPAADGSWPRKGVMQFHHPHGLRQQIISCLEAETPQVKDALLAAGAQVTVLPAADGRPARTLGMQCRRSLFERVLRDAAVATPGVTMLLGHADDVLASGDRAAGLLVDGKEVPAELVLNASGRNGRIGTGLRDEEEGADCGLAYVSRHYELLPGAQPGPTNSPIGLMQRFAGYLSGIFLQDNRTICVLLARLSHDRELAASRHEAAFDAVCAAIPGTAEWTSPEHSRPLTGVLPGGHLRNSYHGQLLDGRVALPGLIHVGDAVCTTNPTAGRGMATSLMQAVRLVTLLDAGGDLEAVTIAFDQWCAEQIKPWFLDHLAWDADEVRQWSGEDVDLSRPLSSGHLLALAEADPALLSVLGPFMAMTALPASLEQLQPRAREIYASGWRPAMPDGPDRDQLAALITASVVSR